MIFCSFLLFTRKIAKGKDVARIHASKSKAIFSYFGLRKHDIFRLSVHRKRIQMKIAYIHHAMSMSYWMAKTANDR